MESYFKNTFSRHILVFCIAWMGCREIYIALIITLIFILFIDILFNDESQFYILPQTFKEHYISLTEEIPPTPEEIKNAESVIERAKNNNKQIKNEQTPSPRTAGSPLPTPY